MTELEVVVDGQPLNDLFSYRATSRLFTFTADPSLVAFDSCVTGTPQVGVTDGYWILMNPLPPGPHTIFIRGVIDFGGGSTFEVQVTYNLTVGPMRSHLDEDKKIAPRLAFSIRARYSLCFSAQVHLRFLAGTLARSPASRSAPPRFRTEPSHSPSASLYQRAIEEVYWRHRIWPEERPDPKPSLDAVMSQAQLEKKVADYLRKSQALENYWQRPITAEQLQAEMDRMAQHTKHPRCCANSLKRSGTILLSLRSVWPDRCCLSAW